MWIEFAIIVILLLGLLYRKTRRDGDYWYRHGIPNTTEPMEPDWSGKESINDVSRRLYNQFKGVPFFGSWQFSGRPCLVIRNDFDLIKSIWIKDFDHFSMAHHLVPLYKATWPATKHEKLVLNTLQTAHGDEWKNLRSTFSPIFTSGKLRKMAPFLQSINKKMNTYVSKLAKENTEFETKELTGKYSLDGLASCAFGVEAGSFDEDNSEFLKHAKGAFGFLSGSNDDGSKDGFLIRAKEFSLGMFMMLKFFLPNIIKKAAAMLGFVNVFHHFLANEHAKFLMNVIEGVVKQRKESEVKRNDLIDMMIDAINKESPTADQEEDDLHAMDQYEKDAQIVGMTKKKKLSHDDVIATALLMLSAGYDTTGTAMSYILYELAINQDCQDTLLEEIREASEDVNNMPYEVLQSLPYLDAVIQETLRKHPVIANLERLCTKDYKIPGHEYVIKKGDVVRVSNVGICYDPDIFQDPKKFNPERFLKENSMDRNPYSYMAFSLGPRNCLAMRFALFEMKVCITSLVSNFKFVPSTRTVKDVEWNPRSFLGGAKGGLWIKCNKR